MELTKKLVKDFERYLIRDLKQVKKNESEIMRLLEQIQTFKKSGDINQSMHYHWSLIITVLTN